MTSDRDRRQADLDPVTEHQRCSMHRPALLAATECGCFYCLEIFQPAEIAEWTDNDLTALCPRCGIDSVIAVRPGIDRAFLELMHRRWF